MCHQWVPLRHTMTTGGRVLCFGCIMGSFEDDDGHEADD